MKKLKNIGLFIIMYLFNIIVEIDIFLNVLIFFGQPTETISSHFGRVWPNSAFAKFIDMLFFWQRVPSHCRSAIDKDINPEKDLLPKEKTEVRVVQILILGSILFIIIHALTR